jgi:hypothetical protein
VVRARVVGHDEIQPTVVVQIHPRDAKPVKPFGVADAGLLGHVGKRAVAIVAEQMIGRTGQPLGAAHHRQRAIGAVRRVRRVSRAHSGTCWLRRASLAGWTVPRRRWRQFLKVERHVAGDVQIEPAVAVVIAERAPGRPAVERHAGAFGRVDESAVAGIAIKPVRAEVRHVQIGSAAVVEVPDADTLAPALVGDAGSGSDIAERETAGVAEQRRARNATRFRLQRRTVDEVHVEHAVVIEIEQRHAGARRFDDVVLVGPARHMSKAGQARLRRHIDVSHSGVRSRRSRRNRPRWRETLRARKGTENGTGDHERKEDRWSAATRRHGCRARSSSALAKAARARTRSPAAWYAVPST